MCAVKHSGEAQRGTRLAWPGDHRTARHARAAARARRGAQDEHCRSGGVARRRTGRRRHQHQRHRHDEW